MLGNTTARYRWFSVAYLILMFFILPIFVFVLSTAGGVVFVAVGGPLLLTFILVIAINLLQRKRRNWLPPALQTWDWLPLWMHSLDPLDHQITRLGKKCGFLSCCIQPTTHHYGGSLPITSNPSQLHILDPLMNETDIGLSPIPSQLHLDYDDRELSPQLTWPQGSKFKLKRKDGSMVNGNHHYVALDMVGYDNYAFKENHKGGPPRSHSGSRSSSPSSSPTSPSKMRPRRSNTLPYSSSSRKTSPTNRIGSWSAVSPMSTTAAAPRRQSVTATVGGVIDVRDVNATVRDVNATFAPTHNTNNLGVTNNTNNLGVTSHSNGKSSSEPDNDDSDVLVTKL